MNDDLSVEAWCEDQRQVVIDYLSHEGLKSPRVGDWPEWHFAPLAAVWAVESKSRPGLIGWWALSGDLPTDYAPCQGEGTPRQGLRDIATKWDEAAKLWARGQQHDDMSLGSRQQEREIAPMLAARAEALLEWVADDSLWEEDPS